MQNLTGISAEQGANGGNVRMIAAVAMCAGGTASRCGTSVPLRGQVKAVASEGVGESFPAASPGGEQRGGCYGCIW